MSTEEGLDRIYRDPSHPGSFGGVENLYREAKKEGLKVTRHRVKKFLQGLPTYTKHKPVRRRYPRNRVYSHGIDFIWQIDLVDLSRLAKFNKGHKFILTVVDVFSKYGWLVPLKNKTGVTLVKAFKSILKEGRYPYKVHADQGTEFTNRNFQALLKENDIAFYSTNNETHASIVERYNRTIKNRLFRYFTDKNTRRYLDVLPRLTASYNARKHRSIGVTPDEVTDKNELKVWETLYGHATRRVRKRFKFKVGDYVRISMQARSFKKGYLPGWTDEVFEIIKAVPRTPPVYRLSDLTGDTLKGTFYTEELQKVLIHKDDYFPIEKILKTRTRNGVKEYFVKYLNWPEKFSAWTTDVKRVRGGL